MLDNIIMPDFSLLRIMTDPSQSMSYCVSRLRRDKAILSRDDISMVSKDLKEGLEQGQN